jgi:hypothetical protein
MTAPTKPAFTTATTNSILAVDIGSVHTRAVLIEKIDGQFRLLARAQALTTAEPPYLDVGIGLNRALTEIGALVGRILVDHTGVIQGTGDGVGVDLFVATASGGRPKKVVLVGLTADMSLLSGRRVMNSTYITLVDSLSWADARSVEAQVNAILSHSPDLILMVGGIDDGAREPMLKLLNTVRLCVSLAGGEVKPSVLYAGNEALRNLVFQSLSPVTQVFFAPNVRPDLRHENLAPAELELSFVYGAYMSSSVGGFQDIQNASVLGVLATAQGFKNVAAYLGELPENNDGVLCVDVGSSNTMVAASLHKRPYIELRTDLGLGHNAVNAVQSVGPEKIRRWLSFEANDYEIMDYAWNKSLRPSTVPQTGNDLEIEYALTRELISLVTEQSRERWERKGNVGRIPQVRQIVGSGAALASATNPGIGALLLLDSLQPTGATRLYLDPYGVMAALGGIAYTEPLVTVQVLDSGGLLDLGTAICPVGKPQPGAITRVNVELANGRRFEREIPSGAVRSLPVPLGHKARVTMKLSRGLKLNGRSSVTLTVEGGAAGVIFDTRGRPFSLPKTAAERAPQFAAWYAGVRGEN